MSKCTCQCHTPQEDQLGQQICQTDISAEDDSNTRYSNGSVKLRNPNIESMEQDRLYHLALSSGTHDLVEMFGDVKFVCMGGTTKRMENFAWHMMKELDLTLPTGTTLLDISQRSYRYCMYKVGPVLSVSHGMGPASLSILLHEIIKLMYHARVRDPVFIRVGSCGGIGLDPGTVVVSNGAVDGTLQPYSEELVLGKVIRRPAKLNQQLALELKGAATSEDPYATVTGTTMCTSDFYEGQGRLDGAFCDYSEQDKNDYLTKLHKKGIVNIEMECTVFAALTHRAGIRSGIVCVTFLDRLKGDQVESPKEILEEWENRPQQLVGRYIKKCLQY